MTRTLSILTLTHVTDTRDHGTGDWRESAACRDAPDAELWFPLGDGPAYDPQIDAAKAICHGCPVIDQCRDWAIANGQHDGIWGGLTPGERRGVVRRRNRRGREPQPIEHGTARGYRTHVRRKEQACDPCMDAYRAHKGVTAPRSQDPRPRPADCADPSPFGPVRHKRRGERPCAACSKARVDYQRQGRERRRENAT